MNLDKLVPRDGYVPKHRLFDAGTLAFHFHVATGTIYRWVSEDELAVYALGRRRLYDLLDVQEAYNRRHCGEALPQELTEALTRGEDSS
jgi:hypothetical protein